MERDRAFVAVRVNRTERPTRAGVMAGLVPAIHAVTLRLRSRMECNGTAWMAGVPGHDVPGCVA